MPVKRFFRSTPLISELIYEIRRFTGKLISGVNVFHKLGDRHYERQFIEKTMEQNFSKGNINTKNGIFWCARVEVSTSFELHRNLKMVKKCWEFKVILN